MSNPFDIAMPFAPIQKSGDTGGQQPFTPSKAPVSISAEELDRLVAGNKVTTVNGCMVIGDLDTCVDPTDAELCVCCKCDRLDLSKDEDRTKYGDLIAEATVNQGFLSMRWEEKVVEGEKLIIYLMYSRLLRVIRNKNNQQV